MFRVIHCPQTLWRSAAMGHTMTIVSSTPSCEILDRDELLARCLGNLEFAMRVLDQFRSRLAQDLSDLDQALQDRNWDLLARLAHRINGASASVSAGQLRLQAAALEHAARARRVADLPAGVERLHGEAERLIHELAVLELDACEAR